MQQQSTAERVRNIVRSAVRRRNVVTMADKIWSRLGERTSARERRAVRAWCEARSRPAAEFAAALDPALWAEAEAFGDKLAQDGRRRLSEASTSFGGGAVYPLLYFLTRLRKPRVVLETGVAAGWSSTAFLEAMAANGGEGRLFSSDFPYFRQRDAENEIGILVPARLRQHWRLCIDGDRINLPLIVGEVERVDFFHYDSDKSYRGRAFAHRLVRPRLAPDAVVVFDDIQDNGHFRDLVAATGSPCRVVGAQDRYAGILGV